MTTYATPGVYYERTDASSQGIAALRTDIAGIVGIAERGPIDIAVPLQSWRQFQAYFGQFTEAGYLAYAVRGFFENGGKKCWVVRVSSPLAATAGVSLSTVAPAVPIWRIAAFSQGVWGNALTVTVRQTHLAQTATLPAAPNTPDFSYVSSVSGFVRGSMVLLTQGGTSQIKVVSDIDTEHSALYWVAQAPQTPLPYDASLAGFDTDRPIGIQSVDYTLLVQESGRLLQIYQGLSLVPEHPRYGPAILGGITIDPDTRQVRALPAAPDPVVIEELRDLDALSADTIAALDTSVTELLPLGGGADGLAQLSVHDFVGEAVDPMDGDAARLAKLRGLRVLEGVDEVAMLAVPDIQIQPKPPVVFAPPPPCVPDPCLPGPAPKPLNPPKPVGDLPPVFSLDDIYEVQAAQISQCESLGDRIALLDAPYSVASDPKLGTAAVRAWRRRFESSYAALYYPWTSVVDPIALSDTAAPPATLMRDVPPCGHVAGQFAASDLSIGVHKAPANALMTWVQNLTVPIDDPTHGVLNAEGINAIRASGSRGIRIMGARTTSGDPDWRFVNVRRLMMMIEKAIYLSLQWAVFEPNDHVTRAKIQLALTSFLLALWQQGALMGPSPDAAFLVRCDDTNNPESAVEAGQLLAEVGVAASQPFEFVVVRVGRTDNEFQITEVGA